MDKVDNDVLKRAKNYPCYAMFYEAAYACTVIITTKSRMICLIS
jgi:hypothetical protein